MILQASNSVIVFNAILKLKTNFNQKICWQLRRNYFLVSSPSLGMHPIKKFCIEKIKTINKKLSLFVFQLYRQLSAC